jgi:hypothetical protein
MCDPLANRDRLRQFCQLLRMAHAHRVQLHRVLHYGANLVTAIGAAHQVRKYTRLLPQKLPQLLLMGR